MILTRRWKQQRVRIRRPWEQLTLYRLGDPDLFLSKLMRDDPQDLADAKFIVGRAGWDEKEIEAIIADACVPDVRELREEFADAAKHFLQWRRKMKDRIVLESAVIAAVTYDREKQTLDVEFRGEGSYRYLKVPALRSIVIYSKPNQRERFGLR